MKKNKELTETAPAGAIGAHGIAVRMDSPTGIPMQRREISFLDFVGDYLNKKEDGGKKVKKPKGKDKKKKRKSYLKEENTFNLSQVHSKLTGIRNQNRVGTNSVSYAVEDDDGNLMKITVRKDQAEKFEAALSEHMADVEEYKMTGRGYAKSIAEILYDLKQQFDIIDVQFPRIPENKIYVIPQARIEEADNEDDEEKTDFSSNFEDDDSEDEFPQNGKEENPSKEPEGDEEKPEEEPEEDIGVDMDEAEEDEEDEKTMLKSLLQMMIKQAEAEIAKAEAEAEKSRALQAEYSAIAAKEEMAKQTELARLEKELEEQKAKEREAKKLADLARYKLRSVAEGKSIYGKLLELDDLDNEMTLRMKRRAIQQIEDPVERRYRLQALASERRIVTHRQREKQQQEKLKKEEEKKKANSIFGKNKDQAGEEK